MESICNKTTVYVHFCNYSKVEVDNALKVLSDEEKSMFLLFYPYELKEVEDNYEELIGDLNYSKLCRLVKEYEKKVRNQLIQNRFDNCSNQSIKLQPVATYDRSNILKVFSGYSMDEILYAISQLPDHSRKIIELRFGLNNNRIYTTSEIAEILDMKSSYVAPELHIIKESVLKKMIKNRELGKVKYFKQKSTEQLDIAKCNGEKNLDIFDNNDALKITISFAKYKEPFKELILLLNNSIQQIVLLLRFGYIFDRDCSEKEIAEILRLSESEVHNNIMSALYNIKSLSSLNSLWVDCATKYLESTNNKSKKLTKTK